MTTHDDFAANEQLAHVELNAVRRQIGSGRFADIDLTQPIRTPSQERGKDTTHTTLRAAVWLVSAVDDLCGKEEKFKNRSEFIRHYMVVGLALERELTGYDPRMDPVVQRAALESKEDSLKALDDSIEKADYLLKIADGDYDRQDTLKVLSGLRDYCEQQGYIGRLRRIDRVISDNNDR